MVNNKLSYTNVVNQQKIIANDSRSVDIPSTGVISTLFTITTTETVTPTARVFIEYNGTMTAITASQSSTYATIGKLSAFYASFNALNALVIQTNSLDAYTATIYYRIYKDGAPS